MKFLSPVDVDGYISLITQNPGVTPTKYLVQDANGRIAFRTGQELKVDIGADYTSVLKHQVKAGVAINKGQAVYVTDANGTNMIVGLASNNSEATSSKTMGLLNATVSANGFADVITEGLLSGLDTSTAVAGNPVWLGTNGNLIYGLANKPYAPNHLVFIGIVTRVNANNGEIFVKVQNGFELDELHDVDLKTTTPINGHLLGYNGTLWVNKTIAGWLGYTPQAQLNGTGFVKASGTTITYDNTSYYPSSNPNGYISSYTETDPTVPSYVKSITSTEKSNWNTAYGWGNHASAGYVPQARTITINGVGYDLSANRSWTISATAVETDTLATVVARGDTTGGNRTIRLDTNGGGITIKGNAGGWATGYYFMGSSSTYRGGFGALGDNDGLSNYWIGPAYNNYYTYIDSSQMSHSSSMRAPIFYDSNNTGYYLDPSSTGYSSFNAGGARFRNIEISNSTYTDTIQNVNTGGNIWINYGHNGPVGLGYGGGLTTAYTGFAVNGTSTTTRLSNTFTISPHSNGVDLHSTGNFAPHYQTDFSWYTGAIGSGTNRATLNSAGDFTANSSSRSPIFYDSNDTAYYLNPNGDSRLSRTYIGNYTNYMTLGAWDGVNNRIEAVGQPLFLTSYGGSIKFGYQGNNQMELTTGGTLLVNNQLSLGNTTNTKIKWGGSTSPTLGLPFTGASNALWLEVNEGDTGGVVIDNEGVTVYGAGDTGYVFRVIDEDVYQSISDVAASTTFYVAQGQNGGGYMRGIFNVTDYLTAGNSVRGPIFYDSNDTTYYTDPASTSNLYNLQLTGAKHTYLYINPGNGYEAMVRYNGGSGNTWYAGKRTTSTTQAGTDGFHFYSDAAGDTVVGFGTDGTIRGKGDVVAYSSSDRQLKDNILPIENALEKVKQIGGYTFDWNDKQTIYEGHDIGVIAQEIEAVLPEVVTTRDTGFKAVKYEKIIPLLIEAMKEQQTQIEELKQLVNQLINK